MGLAQRVIPWNPKCDLPAGTYTLTLRDATGGQAEWQFQVSQPTRQQILTIPQRGRPGVPFVVYYCGYKSLDTPEVEMELYRETDRTDNPAGGFSYTITLVYTWTVSIGANGWTSETLRSLPADPAGAYLIRDAPGALKGWDLIWLGR